MAVSSSIFAVTERSDSAAKFADDIVGAFRIGYQDDRGNPHSVAEWIVLTDDPDVGEVITEEFGGQTEESGNERYPIRIFTTTNIVEILVSPGAIRSGLALWGNRTLVSRCDGETITWSTDDPQDVGKRCACAGKSPEDRKKGAKNGTGCKPDVSILFSLADFPALGKFRMQSGSEILLRDIQGVEGRVNGRDEASKLTMSVERVTTKAGFVFSKVSVVESK